MTEAEIVEAAKSAERLLAGAVEYKWPPDFMVSRGVKIIVGGEVLGEISRDKAHELRAWAQLLGVQPMTKDYLARQADMLGINLPAHATKKQLRDACLKAINGRLR